MSVDTIALQIDHSLVDRIDRSAEAEHGTRSTVVERALESYFAQEEYELDLIRQGILDADAGRLVSLQSVLEEMKHWVHED